MKELKNIVSGNEKELCMRCAKETQYDTDIHIDAREHYILGYGQLCDQCHDVIYNKK